MARILTIIILLVCGSLFAQNAKYHATFHIEKFYVEGDQIHWSTTEESGALPFQVEQYLCGTWTKVGEVMGTGTADTNRYSIKINFHNGDNHFRIKQWGSESGPRLSRPVIHKADTPEVDYVMENKKIKFSRETFYLLSKEETTVKTGYGASLDMLSLDKGEYKLCFGTRTEVIEIK